jgi:GntR family transcriptional regulator / MocR family aminotransferase
MTVPKNRLALGTSRRRSGESAHGALSTRLRSAILSGTLPPNARLPSARALGLELSLARGTIVGVYERLESEGYLVARGAAGTFVSACLPAGTTPAPSPPKSQGARRASSKLDAAPVARSFQVGVPAVESFPSHIWSRLLARHSRRATARDLARADPCGDPALRGAIAAYLAVSRGVVARPEQVIVTAGYQGALGLLCAAFPGPQHRAWVEEPGYQFTRHALTLAGLRVQPIPVDDEGIAFAGRCSNGPSPDLVFVTASHQMPLGMPLSLARRLSLLAFARARAALIVEDDYDGEFHYASRPLPALASLEPDGPVIYAGTFSKVMFPGLRLGYLVVPEGVRERLERVATLLTPASGFAAQAATADFLGEGHLARHVRRMRRLYAERREALLSALAERASDELLVTPRGGGLLVLARFAPDRQRSDQDVVRRAKALRLSPTPLSVCFSHVPRRGGSGLLLGFAGLHPSRARAEVDRLVSAIVASPLV